MAVDAFGFQSTHPGAPASGRTYPEQTLSFVYPPAHAQLAVSVREDLLLGRSPAEGVFSIFDETISRQHARVCHAHGGLLCMQDLGSRNGTRLNGITAATPLPLSVQTVVRLGDVLGVVDAPCERSFDADPVVRGQSARMAAARARLDAAGPQRAPILIHGETGTGKERLAAEVHRLSGRSGPFLAINCAELSPQLIESQLFGYERGAFTGAANSRTGLFVAAHGGTLFLDEVGELPLDLQPKLLRVLQEGEVRPLGGTSVRHVDVRVVAATNRDLPDLIARDRFRRDLYARLAFFEIELPPLRERRQDILSWIDVLHQNNQPSGNVQPLQFSPDAAEMLLLYGWPDNLRGLDRLVHRLGTAPFDRAISARALTEALPELGTARSEPPRADPLRSEPPRQESAQPAVNPDEPGAPAQRRPTREEFLAVYAACQCSVRATSRHYGKDRRQIYRWLEAFGIPREHAQE